MFPLHANMEELRNLREPRKLSEPLVSIIVPTFNSEKVLIKCLSSIKKQIHQNIEVVVVDYFSGDKTREIAERYGAQIITSDAERSEARNIGARMSSGEFVFFVDSDMELSPEVVRECVRKVGEGFDAIIVPEISVGEGFWARCKALEKLCYIGDETIEAARFFKKSTFNSVKGYDEELEVGEDWDLSQRINKAGFKVGRVYALVKHHEGSLALWKTVKKKYEYGKTLSIYRTRHPIEARQQLRILRPAFTRNWKKLAKDPLHALGLFLMKIFEFGAGGLGQLKSNVRAHQRKTGSN